MTVFRIVCVVRGADRHGHVVTIGTGHDPDRADQFWATARAVAAIGRGDRFVVRWSDGSPDVPVEIHPCECGVQVLRVSDRGGRGIDGWGRMRRCHKSLPPPERTADIGPTWLGKRRPASGSGGSAPHPVDVESIAVGFLAVARGVDQERARALLQEHSDRTGQDLGVVARHVVENRDDLT